MVGPNKRHKHEIQLRYEIGKRNLAKQNIF